MDNNEVNEKNQTSYQDGRAYARFLRDEIEEIFMDEDYGTLERQWFLRGFKEELESFDG
jgi:hypothetical protein